MRNFVIKLHLPSRRPSPVCLFFNATPHLACMPHLILSVIGEDQPGIVRELSSIITKNNSSWKESRLLRIAGQFAGIVQIDAPEESLQQIIDSLDSLTARGLDVSITIQSVHKPETAHHDTVAITLTANNRNGIVEEVASMIYSLGMNIEELITMVESGAMCGNEIFHATILVGYSNPADIEKLVHAIDKTSDDIIAEIDTGHLYEDETPATTPCSH